MDKFPITYKNMTKEDMIENGPFLLHPDIEFKCINIGPDSKLTTGCDLQDTGPYLTFDSINWNDIIIVDVKAESFITGVAQEVLNKFIYNSNKRLFIHLCVGQTQVDEWRKMIFQEVSDYFNQINSELRKIKRKAIYLEYVIIDNQTIYLKLLSNMKIDIFCEIEIWNWDLCTVEKLWC